jgi:hypothetical protein
VRGTTRLKERRQRSNGDGRCSGSVLCGWVAAAQLSYGLSWAPSELRDDSTAVAPRERSKEANSAAV